LAYAASPERACAQDYPKLAPYSGIRWTPEIKPEVQIGGNWYALRSINELPVDKIVEFAKKAYGSRWRKRFNEDLVQVLTEMGHPPETTVTLAVVELETGKRATLEEMPLTAENRRSIMRSRRTHEPRAVPFPAVKPEDLRRALNDFQVALNDRWSYRHANRADFDGAVDALRRAVDAGLSPSDFGIELQKIVAMGIDGHASVSGYGPPPGGCLPFLVEPEGDRFVAFKPDRTGFLADGFPYLMKIDGKAVTDWCQVAAPLVPKGSPQYVRRHCLRRLRALDQLRGWMKLPKRGTLEIELASEDGRSRKTLSLPTASHPPRYGVWPRGGSRLLKGEIGYLRLAAMDRESGSEIKKWMSKFRDSAGLIVDVRDNGGGSRDALRLLYSYLAAPGNPPHVFTAAAYRLHEEHKGDHLAARFMYRADAKEWTNQERRAIATFARNFKPAWALPKGQFSEWHYMALSRIDDPNVYHYKMPVVVLMNEKCFSATDVFLAGLKGLKNLTLLGTPSGGGSARSRRVDLGGTPFTLRIGTMASFQADGRLFDGHGVSPDVTVAPDTGYHIGDRDNALDAAVERIKAR